jgi:twitching motility protein PilT
VKTKPSASRPTFRPGAGLGMITMDTHLMSLYNRELISADECAEKAQDTTGMREKLIGMGAQLKEL